MPEDDVKQVTETVLKLEHDALVRWSAGDPSGFLEISAPEVTYFDPFVTKRIDGLIALRDYYEGLRGKIYASSFEIITPLVQLHGDVAILTYHLSCVLSPGKVLRWNCTEVFRHSALGWQIIQSHWSQTK